MPGLGAAAPVRLVKFREHKGSYEDSMATAVEVEGWPGLLAHLQELAWHWPSMPPVDAQTVQIQPYYGIDHRNGWDTYIVSLHNYGVMGFTDGPVDKKAQ